MTPAPTGRVVRSATGRDLVLERHLPLAPGAVWSGLTEPETTGRWFATWSGSPREGDTVRATLTGEEGAEVDIRVERCEPPRHLAVSSVDEHGSWHLEVTLEESGGGTGLTFVHHLDDETDIGSIGPGWEYYLDRFAAVFQGGPEPAFEDYFPAQQDYYRRL